MDIDVPVKHRSCVAPKFLSTAGKHLTFRPLNGVTGFLPTNSQLAMLYDLGTGQTNRQTAAINA